MREMPLNIARPGFKLARPIYTDDDQILLNEGVFLKENHLARLKDLGVQTVFVQTGRSNEDFIFDVISNETRSEAIKTVKHIMAEVKKGKPIHVEESRKIVDAIVDQVFSNRTTLVNLKFIKSTDDYTFDHSVNVCVLSLMIGTALGYKTAQLKELGTGGLLHDVGKVKVPEHILNKPASLTEEELVEMKKHSWYGYQILNECKDISESSKYVAHQHHERFRGGGYPNSLKENEIHDYARIAAIADVYDAFTSDRVYRKKIMPHEAMEIIYSASGFHFDPYMVKVFMQNVATYPMGTVVKLNSGETGIIVDINRELPIRPILKITNDKDGEPVSGYVEYNLMQHPTKFISEVVEI